MRPTLFFIVALACIGCEVNNKSEPLRITDPSDPPTPIDEWFGTLTTTDGTASFNVEGASTIIWNSKNEEIGWLPCDDIQLMIVSSDQRTVGTFHSSDQMVRLWRRDADGLALHVVIKETDFTAWAFGHGDAFFAMGTDSGKIVVHDLRRGTTHCLFQSTLGPIYSVWSTDRLGEFVFGGLNRLSIVQYECGQTQQLLINGLVLAVSGDANLFAITDRKKSLVVIDRQMREMISLRLLATSASFSSDKTKLVVGSNGMELTVWDLKSNQKIEFEQDPYVDGYDPPKYYIPGGLIVEFDKSGNGFWSRTGCVADNRHWKVVD